MNKVVIYKENEDLSPVFEKVKLSNSENYVVITLSEKKHLSEKLSNNPKALLFYFSQNLSQADRVFLRHIQRQLPFLKIVLASDEKYAMDAWRLDLMHFITYPYKKLDFTKAYTKYCESLSVSDKFFQLKTRKGVHKIAFQDVCFMRADGNFTYFYFINDKAIIQTKKLKEFEFASDRDSWFRRIHRSWMINFANIQRIEADKIFFRGRSEPLKIESVNLQKTIKRELLGLQ